VVTAKRLLDWYTKEVGVREYPLGSNDGVRVNYYQSSTGAYNAAWCVSFLQKGLQALGVPRVADRTAGVFYLVGWARKYGLTRSTPKPGYFVAFMRGTGHIGVVKYVFKNGSFRVVEGNATNRVRGDRIHPRNGPYVFIRVPKIDYGDAKPVKPPVKKPKWLPRFQIVTGEGPKVKVLAGWGTWKNIAVRIPRLVAEKKAFRIQRKLIRNPKA
jgi:hypothetical protein